MVIKRSTRKSRARKKEKMEVVVDFVQTQCVERCNPQWFQCAREVLMKNIFNNYVFADALRESVTKRRQKMWILCL